MLSLHEVREVLDVIVTFSSFFFSLSLSNYSKAVLVSTTSTAVVVDGAGLHRLCHCLCHQCVSNPTIVETGSASVTDFDKSQQGR